MYFVIHTRVVFMFSSTIIIQLPENPISYVFLHIMADITCKIYL